MRIDALRRDCGEGPLLSRRTFVRVAGALGAQAVVGSSLSALGCDGEPVGELQPPDANGIRLPLGFVSRIVARSGTTVPGTGHVWHGAPDGGAVFPSGDGGWIYVSNAELTANGGVSALRFSASGVLVDAYPICSGTRRNCAGGASPWGTWLTCEEVADGIVYECDPFGRAAPIPRPALGTFNHEAVAFDAAGRAYLTEDRPDGRLYRFTPNAAQNLGTGVLEVLGTDVDARVHWDAVPNPNPTSTQTPTRRQVVASLAFNGGEGIDSSGDRIYFTTKGDSRVWELDLAHSTIRIRYDRASDALAHLSGVDNLVVASNGALVVAEDGGNMELVLVSAWGIAVPLLRVEGQPGSELAGPAFDPSRTRLYFSSQRGFDGRGITYEVEGPFYSLG